MVSKELLEMLRCPETKAELVLDGETLVSVDAASRRRYRIVNDIPIMLIEESEVLEEAVWKEIMVKNNRQVK